MTQTKSATGFCQTELLGIVPNLRAFAKTLTGRHDLADDLVQDTLVKAWKNQDKFETGTNLKAWLFTILRNTFLSNVRRRSAEVEDPDGLHLEHFGRPEGQSAHVDMLDFAKVFAQLPPDQREALILVGAEGFTCEEAAEMCGCAVGTIKSRVSRARSKLHEMLGLDEGDMRAVKPKPAASLPVA